jgi:hypothetical protein
MAGVQTLDASRPAIAAATELGYCYAPYQIERSTGSASRLRRFERITCT